MEWGLELGNGLLIISIGSLLIVLAGWIAYREYSITQRIVSNSGKVEKHEL